MSNTRTQNVVGYVLMFAIIGAGAFAYSRYPDNSADGRAEPAEVETSGEISMADYRSITEADTLDAVRGRFGEPTTEQEMDIDLPDAAAGYVEAGTEDHQCIYYKREDEAVSMIQFCFDGNGKYVSKASY